MVRFSSVLVVAGLVAAVAASSASAATIYEVMGTVMVDPYHPLADQGSGGSALLFGTDHYSLMWSSSSGDGSQLTLANDGQPTGAYTGTWHNSTGIDNPNWLVFQDHGSQSGGTNSQGQTNTGVHNYTVAGGDEVSRRFQYSIYLFDPTMADTQDAAARLTVTGSLGTVRAEGAPSDLSNVVTVSAAEMRAGIMVTFDVLTEAGESLGVQVESLLQGKLAEPAGFFLDKVNVEPEPATLSLLAMGLGGMLLRRRRK